MQCFYIPVVQPPTVMGGAMCLASMPLTGGRFDSCLFMLLFGLLLFERPQVITGPDNQLSTAALT